MEDEKERLKNGTKSVCQSQTEQKAMLVFIYYTYCFSQIKFDELSDGA